MCVFVAARADPLQCRSGSSERGPESFSSEFHRWRQVALFPLKGLTGRAAGHEVVRTREPGGTPLGEKIRGLLLTDEMTPRTETLLFFAARCEHAEKVIKPALERGAWVLSDRFTDATYAYQTGGKGMKGEDVEALEAWTLAGFAPDVTVLFDLAPEVAARRPTLRAGEGDRFERESADFFARVRNAYLDRAARDPKRFVRVNAEEAPETIAAQLEKEFAKWL